MAYEKGSTAARLANVVNDVDDGQLHTLTPDEMLRLIRRINDALWQLDHELDPDHSHN